MNMQFTLDKTAIGLTLLCAAHCMILPLVATLAPSSVTLALSSEAFHQWLLWGIIPISIFAFSMGCRKHKSYPVFIFGAIGILILSLTALFAHDYLGETAEKVLTLVGGAVIAVSHISNYKLCRDQECQCQNT